MLGFRRCVRCDAHLGIIGTPPPTLDLILHPNIYRIGKIWSKGLKISCNNYWLFVIITGYPFYLHKSELQSMYSSQLHLACGWCPGLKLCLVAVTKAGTTRGLASLQGPHLWGGANQTHQAALEPFSVPIYLWPTEGRPGMMVPSPTLHLYKVCSQMALDRVPSLIYGT